MTILIGLTMLAFLLSFGFFPMITIGKWRGQTFWIITFLGAMAVWAMQGFSLTVLMNAWTGSATMSPLRILLLFFSFTFLATYLDEVGFIKYLAYVALTKAGMRQGRLFLIWFSLVSLATILTANDIVILTLTPFMIYFARHAKIHPLPYLVGQFVAANTWSMMLVIGNPTNIYFASMYAIDFMNYVAVMFIPTMLTGLASYGLVRWVFRASFTTPIDRPTMVINPPHPSYREGTLMLGIAIVMMSLAKPLTIAMDLVSVLAVVGLALVVMVKYPQSKSLWYTMLRLPWTMAPFFLSMTVLVAGLNVTGITAWMMTLLQQFPPTYGYGIGSFLVSNLMNNIPMSVWFVDVMEGLSPLPLQAIYASIIGSNLGAILTPIGALAGLMWLTILKDKQVAFSLKKFLQYGLLIGVPLLMIALLTMDVILSFPW
jgi:arsenical pump membrane protein